MDLPSLWDRLLLGMQKRIGHQDVEIWLKNSFPVALNGGVLQLEVANRYYSDWISDNYLDELIAEASAVIGDSVTVEFTCRDEPQSAPSKASPKKSAPSEPGDIGVNAHQTFDSFVIGECNRFAQAAAMAVADMPAEAYNPLYIYGGSGLGKTHLLHSIANHILATKRSARVVYVTAEDFMNEMINCIRYKRMDDFRNKYRRRATVLLVDDIQFLSGRERTQEEFFHTFNSLQNSGHQVVMTSDVMPREIDKLVPRLRTRFEGGLLADMQPPDKETLMAILAQKADIMKLEIPGDVAEAIANGVAGNVRELEGVLNRLGAMQRFYSKPITIAFARERMPNIFSAQPTSVTVPGIIEAVARYHSLRSADIVGKKRTRTLTVPRHIAMFLARKHTKLSFPELGREFGGRDHSTIQHGFRKVQDELNDNADLAYKIRLIEQGLNVS